jgi:hypothetical protein
MMDNAQSSNSADDDSAPSPDLKAVEAQLAALRPRDDRLDRERLMFLAGQASVQVGWRRQPATLARWGWSTSFGAVAGTAAAVFVMLVLRSVEFDRFTAPAGGVRGVEMASAGEPSQFWPPRLEGRLYAAGMPLKRYEQILDLNESIGPDGDGPLVDVKSLAADSPSFTSRSFDEALGPLYRADSSM